MKITNKRQLDEKLSELIQKIKINKDFNIINLHYKSKLKIQNTTNKKDNFFFKNDKFYNLFKKNSRNLKIIKFNENLKLINKYKNKINKLEKLNNSKNSKIIIEKLNDENYYSNFLDNICRSIKNSGENNIINDIDLEKDIIFKNKKINRYLKDKKEVNYLNDFFEKNNYKWSKNLIDQLAKNLNLSKFCIYRWNWEKLNKIKK